MTLAEFATSIEASELDRARVVGLTRLAVELQAAGVKVGLEQLADKTSLTAWIAASRWGTGREVELAADFAESAPAREELYKQVVTQLAEVCE